MFRLTPFYYLSDCLRSFHLHSIGCYELPPGTYRRQCSYCSRKGCLAGMGSSEARHYPSRVRLDRGLCQVAPVNSRLHRPSILKHFGYERAECLTQQPKEHVRQAVGNVLSRNIHKNSHTIRRKAFSCVYGLVRCPCLKLLVHDDQLVS